MAKSAMQPASPQTERTLESGVANHKAYAMSGSLPGAGDTFGVESFALMQGRSAQRDSGGGRISDRARATPPPARNGNTLGRSQSDADHGSPD